MQGYSGLRWSLLFTVLRLRDRLESIWMDPRRIQTLKRAIRRRFISPLWQRLLLSLEVPFGYPDYLSNLVDEACEDFIEGKYISCLLAASLSVEWVLISETAPKRLRGLVERIECAKGIGLPVEKLFDMGEIKENLRETIFVKRRNKLAHGDVHEYPHPQGLIVFRAPRTIHQMDWFNPVVNASDAYDQLSKALRFLIAWRRRALSRRQGGTE